MNIFFNSAVIEEIRAKYEKRLYLPSFVWVIVGLLIIAIVVILVWLHFLPA